MTTEENEILATITAKVNSISDVELDRYANTLQWESYGAGPRKLVELESSHLENILITQRQITLITSKTILYILKKRSVIS